MTFLMLLALVYITLNTTVSLSEYEEDRVDIEFRYGGIVAAIEFIGKLAMKAYDRFKGIAQESVE